MTYTIDDTTESYELKDSDGNVVETFDSPLTTPDDIIDAILDDMGVGTPQAEAFKVLFKQDWEFASNQSS